MRESKFIIDNKNIENQSYFDFDHSFSLFNKSYFKNCSFENANS